MFEMALRRRNTFARPGSVSAPQRSRDALRAPAPPARRTDPGVTPADDGKPFANVLERRHVVGAREVERILRDLQDQRAATLMRTAVEKTREFDRGGQERGGRGAVGDGGLNRLVPLSR